MTRTPELTGFCREAWPRLVGALSLYTGDRHVAEEMAQEALVRVCERWTEVQAIVDVVSPQVEPAEALTLRQAVAALPEAQRRALVLRYYADLPVTEVALLMECPENTVKTHTRRAIEQLRGAGLAADEATDDLPVEAREVHGG